MSKDKVDPVYNKAVAATNDPQTIERAPNAIPTPLAASPIRPWTDDFLLPSIRYREPSAVKVKGH